LTTRLRTTLRGRQDAGGEPQEESLDAAPAAVAVALLLGDRAAAPLVGAVLGARPSPSSSASWESASPPPLAARELPSSLPAPAAGELEAAPPPPAGGLWRPRRAFFPPFSLDSLLAFPFGLSFFLFFFFALTFF